jgi:broad specificity phosphatase PhoE
MPRMYVIQTGRTTWDEEARVESAPGAPLTASGRKDVQDAAKELASHTISIIYACGGQAEQQTAQLVADALGAKVRTHNDFRELDYGLWQGLTQDEIKRRQPKLFRQWSEDPASVRPPGGETLGEAQQRLCKAVKEVLKRHRNGGALVVLRPVALGLIKCLIRRDGVGSLRQNVHEACCWDVLEADMSDLEGS